MKVSFVYIDRNEADPEWSGYYYTGIALLSAILKQAGHETSLIHFIKPEIRDEEFVEQLNEERPDVLAFSCTTLAFMPSIRLAQLARDLRPDLTIACGGLHPTLAPEKVINTPPFDILCRGEGEHALLELVQCIDEGRPYTDIPNLWVREGDRVHRNPMRPLLQDIDSLPFGDRDIFEYRNLEKEKQGRGCIMMSRGCPFTCTYCANHALKKLYKGQPYIRFRSVDNVMAELEEMLNKYDFIHCISVDDDLPFIKKSFTEEFCEKYKERIGLPFVFNLRPNLDLGDRLRMLKDAGATQVKVGLECGNEYILNKVLNRRFKVAEVERTFRTCLEVGLEIQSFNMVGIPEETPRTILDTIKLNARISPSVIQVSIFYPFPGTKLLELCEERGMINKTDCIPSDYFSRTVLDHKNITKKQVHFFYHYFHHLVKIYQWAFRKGRDEQGWRARLLDGSLVFEPTRRLWGLALRIGLPLKHFLFKKKTA